MENIGIAKLKSSPGLNLRRILSTRRGAVVVAGIAGLMAFMLLLAFMSAAAEEDGLAKPPSVSVLVADQTIEKGTPGDVIAEGKLFRTTKVPETRVPTGAITDSGSLSGLVTIKNVYPGHKFTMADLAPGNAPIVSRLTGIQRAVSLPVDTPHGNLGQVRTGSRVDVFATPKNLDEADFIKTLQNRKLVRVVARNALVLKTPGTEEGALSGGAEAEMVVVRLTDAEATRALLAAEAGNLWILIRPPAIAENSTLPSERGG